MSESIRHRGPDASGAWIDLGSRVALAHRRLSVLDLSGAGAQPMESQSRRFVLIYNGEIYNHLELRSALSVEASADVARRSDLAGQSAFGDGRQVWNGSSDTETLLAAFDAWGIKASLERSVGMFALAVWDCEARVLTLARDRIGEKPLYYGTVQGAFVFGSELRTFREYPGFSPRLDRLAVSDYIRYSYVPSPQTIFQNVKKVPPGCLLTVSLRNADPEIASYWSLPEIAANARAAQYRGSRADAAEELETLLKRTVRQQLLSDVPVGAFLSGGVDSPLIVALMQAAAGRSVKTFTIGYAEAGYSEARNAGRIARYLGTDHLEMQLSASDILNAFHSMPRVYDEPFADPSQLPTYIVAGLARRRVTVVLSGDGGDEVFGGYNRYLFVSKYWSTLALLPKSLRTRVGTMLASVPPNTWNKLLGFLPVISVGDKVHKASSVLHSGSIEDFYKRIVSNSPAPADFVLGAEESVERRHLYAASPIGGSDVEQMLLTDSLTYLPDDVLVKVDRAAMSHSLETRAPYLDHRIIEFAWRLPLHYKISGNTTKRVLRDVLHKYVPESLLKQPKMGFGFPIDLWLRGPLARIGAELLDPAVLNAEGIFRSDLVQEKWKEHQSGARNWSNLLWAVVMFQLWWQENK